MIIEMNFTLLCLVIVMSLGFCTHKDGESNKGFKMKVGNCEI